MTTATLTDLRPVAGPVWDKSKPETRQPWQEFRAGGITATQIRDWGTASKRRQIIDEKVSGVFEDLSHLPYVEHGNRREPIISAWAQGRFGITPCENTFAHPENPRHLASPDGISLDPFTGELIVGTHDAIVMEIKTSKNDLTPGRLDDMRVLMEIQPGSDFERSNYYTQMQWQMYVMNATMTLFVYEQHDDVINPETGTFTPVGPPEFAWVPRDQALIDVLVEKVAPQALAEIDAARMALKGGELPPASDFPAEDAILVQDVVKGRQAESLAKTSRDRAFKALQEKYVGKGKPDFTEDLGFAKVTVSTSTPAPKRVVTQRTDWDAVRAGLTEAQRKKYDALVAKHTSEVVTIEEGVPTQRLTITEKKVKP